MIDDMRSALQTMKRSPEFVVIAVVVLALGFAVTGAVFSTVNGWLSVGTAIPNADRLVVVAPTRHGTETPTGYFKETSYTRLFERTPRTLRDLFATEPVPVVLSVNDVSVNVRMEAVAGPYFEAIGVPPLLGRALRLDDDRSAGDVPVVLGESTWRRLFAGAPDMIGRSIHLSGLVGTIVGIMPASVRGFSTPSSTAVDVWAPTATVRSLVAPSGQPVWGQVFGRLADGVSFPQAAAEMRVIGSRFDPDDADLGAVLLPVDRGVMPPRARVGLSIVGTGLVALSSLVLLIACANLANLLLARSASRSSEVAVRMALGATPSRILRLQLFETGSVTLLGGVVGFAIVSWASRVVGRFTLYADGGSVMTLTLLVNWWVLAYFFVLIASASLAIGALPAMRAIRIDPAQFLATSGSRGRSTGRFERKRTLLVASQVAASTVLLIVAGLFVRSALRASHYDVAFDTGHLALGHFDFGPKNWNQQVGRDRQETLIARARGMPGIRDAAVSTGLPAGGGGELVDIEPDDVGFDRQQVGPPCRSLSVSPGFFRVVGPLALRGRDFTTADNAAGRSVVIVNDEAAARLWPGRDPLGRRLRVRNGNALDVVGVVPETDRTAQDATERCSVFVPMGQRYKPQFILAVSSVPPAASLLKPLATRMAGALPGVSMFDVTTAEAYLNRAGGPSRSVALALAVLGVLGLTIAVVGLYGVMAYVVGLRQTEFGIRRALGATDGQIYRLVLGEAGRMLIIGIVAGLPVAYAVSVSVASTLVGVTSHDGVTYFLVPACLVAAGVLAAWWPARRAALVEPAVALRSL